jgi:hypothetical protein
MAYFFLIEHKKLNNKPDNQIRKKTYIQVPYLIYLLAKAKKVL